jgi:fructose-1,6-bisphosphatase/sedoheptulose 1,7-bisphosphatase-like protein
MKKLLVTPEGEQFIDLNNEEVIRYENDLSKAEADTVARLAKEEQEKARKDSAIAKLKALGLTEEEVKSIL